LRRAALRDGDVQLQPRVREATPGKDRHLEEGARRRGEDVQDKLGQALPIAPQYAVSHLENTADPWDRCERVDDACAMGIGLTRAARLAAKGPHEAAIATALELARA